MLRGRGHCDQLITRPEESYRLWCIVVCDLENLKNEEAMTHVGRSATAKKKKNIYIYINTNKITMLEHVSEPYLLDHGMTVGTNN